MPRGRRRKFKVNFNVNPETIRSIFSLGLITISLIILISFFAPNYSLNSKIQSVIKSYFGGTAILVPFIIGGFGLIFVEKLREKFKEVRVIVGLFLFLLGFAGFLHVFYPLDEAHELALKGKGGGMLGYIISSTLSSSISKYGAVAVLLILIAISIFLIFNLSIDQLLSYFSGIKLPGFLSRDKEAAALKAADLEITSGPTTMRDLEDENDAEDAFSSNSEDLHDSNDEPELEVIPSLSEPLADTVAVEVKGSSDANSNLVGTLIPRPLTDRIWQNPPYDLLAEPPSEVRDVSDSDKRGKVIKETLKNFGIDVEIDNVQVGPSVTQYSLRTKSITKVSKIASLHEDLAYALASPTGSVRVEAPIPGKSLIGIEVPNLNRTTVFFKSLITSDYMKSVKSKLGIVLGKDVGGRTHVNNISSMPHMLIAGATGSGKSVFIHNILFSILFRASPSEVKFIMIDPKRVELAHYQGIPHLLTPVVTEMDKAPSVFRWAVDEMERRYKLFEQARVRNIDGYNEKSGIQIMPYIVIVVDEMAEIMMGNEGQNVEKSIIRIAQLSRATGLHLVLATQRPSINVVTGLIKANIPCRVSLKVASQIDSRVIIDQPGAEKLLDKGDMLFIPPADSKPIRLQGAYISDKEIAALVDYLKAQGVPADYREDILTYASNQNSKGSGSSDWGSDVDEYFDQAVEIVTSTGKASASLLQRKLSIGYARAARIIDEMEEKGVIGPANNSSKAREVLISDVPHAESNIDIE